MDFENLVKVGFVHDFLSILRLWDPCIIAQRHESSGVSFWVLCMADGRRHRIDTVNSKYER